MITNEEYGWIAGEFSITQVFLVRDSHGVVTGFTHKTGGICSWNLADQGLKLEDFYPTASECIAAYRKRLVAIGAVNRKYANMLSDLVNAHADETTDETEILRKLFESRVRSDICELRRAGLEAESISTSEPFGLPIMYHPDAPKENAK